MEDRLEKFYQYVRPELLRNAENVPIDITPLAEQILVIWGTQVLADEDKEQHTKALHTSREESREQHEEIAALLHQNSRQSMSIAELAQWAIQQPVSDDAKTDFLHYAATLLPKLQEQAIQKIPEDKRVVYLAFARHQLIRELLNLR